MKNFIKNNIKTFMTILITTIVVGSVSVYAASQYFAKDIIFTPTNENFKKENGEPINNVEDALNELYDKKNNNECISGTLTHNSNTNIDLNVGFEVTKAELTFNNGIGVLYVFYNKNFSNKAYALGLPDKNSDEFNLSYDNGIFSFILPTYSNSYKNNYVIEYVACK